MFSEPSICGDTHFSDRYDIEEPAAGPRTVLEELASSARGSCLFCLMAEKFGRKLTVFEGCLCNIKGGGRRVKEKYFSRASCNDKILL
ncbi:unnamed protein product [Phytomonas sp. EM1]|nr:unnamed protein product [Phytomonas sp. EM1]|eukprot:CCW63133.1 unnamed protein product [Phytomonas sp. isolate EM1]